MLHIHSTEVRPKAESQKPSETKAKKPTKTKKQKPSETKAKKPTKTENQKPREAKIKSQRPKAKWACKWEIKTQKILKQNTS